MLATIARRHTPSGQRYEWVGGTSPHGVFDPPPPFRVERRVTDIHVKYAWAKKPNLHAGIHLDGLEGGDVRECI